MGRGKRWDRDYESKVSMFNGIVDCSILMVGCRYRASVAMSQTGIMTKYGRLSCTDDSSIRRSDHVTSSSLLTSHCAIAKDG